MATENKTLHQHEAPAVNFSRGLKEVAIPELGPANKGKVRDNWITTVGDQQVRVMVTTDRQSAFDKVVCTTPGKGRVLNLISAHWFGQTEDIVPNQVISVPHPNVTIARQAVATVPVEMVVRRFMAESSTSTSIFYNYDKLGRRTIYGIDFPDGLRPNEELPMGTIITPTTKGSVHDEERTEKEAEEEVDALLGKGTYDRARTATLAIFERARVACLEAGLILPDSKYEFGVDANGELFIIDELHSPDSSRFWLNETYSERFEAGKTPRTFDKQILRDWLSAHGFKGEGPVPKIDPEVLNQMSQAYETAYQMITGAKLTQTPDSRPETIRQSVLSSLAVLS